MKTEGLLNSFTDLKNPNFSKIAEAVGIKGFEATKTVDLEQTVKEFLAYPGAALLDVHTNRYELIMPPDITEKNVAGMVTYGMKALISGRIKDVEGLMVDPVHTLKKLV
jgi:pyruvate dehydrogenase (quinone)